MGMTQVEAAQLLGQHKSWVCRRLALLEKLSVAVKEDLRLGLVGPSLARQLTRLPVGNQEAVLALARRESLTAQEVSGVIDLLQGASPEQAAFVLAKPREALAQVQGMPAALVGSASEPGGELAGQASDGRRWKRWCAWRTGCARRTNASCTSRIGRFCSRCCSASAIRRAWWRNWCWVRDVETGEIVMNEAMRLEIVQRRQSGHVACRRSPTELGISRGAVQRVLARVQAQRDGQAAPSRQAAPRGSIIDPFEPILQELLAKYPNLTAERAVQELQARGFTGKYTVVRERVRLLRPRAAPSPCRALKPGRGQQAQMDYGVYDIDFTREGRRRVYLFSYLLGYSRRQYLRFVESMDLPTTAAGARARLPSSGRRRPRLPVRQLQGRRAAARCRRRRSTTPSSSPSPRTTASGPRRAACAGRRPRAKSSGSSTTSKPTCSMAAPSTPLEHLNEVTAQWLANVADVRVLRDFKESPLQRHQREQPHLLPLPSLRLRHRPGRLSPRQRRGLLTHRLNFYSVPWSYIGQVLPVRITESEVIIYSVRLEEIARHPLVPRTQTGVRQLIKSHHPADDPDRADTAPAATLRRTRPGRRAVPRRPARQANPGQAASPAAPGPGRPVPA